MRLILRILGTWFLGIAVILVIIDGIKSLGADGLVTTSLGDTWAAVNGQSLTGLRDFIDSRFFGPVLDPLLTLLLGAPGFIALVIPAVVLLIAGRPRNEKRFVEQDQF